MKKIIAFMSVAFLAIAVDAQQSPMPLTGSKNPEAKPVEIKPVVQHLSETVFDAIAKAEVHANDAMVHMQCGCG